MARFVEQFLPVPIRLVPEDPFGSRRVRAQYILTEGTGRGQSRWFRVEACLIMWSTPHFWGRPEREFGVPAQDEAEARFK